MRNIIESVCVQDAATAFMIPESARVLDAFPAARALEAGGYSVYIYYIRPFGTRDRTRSHKVRILPSGMDFGGSDIQGLTYFKTVILESGAARHVFLEDTDCHR